MEIEILIGISGSGKSTYAVKKIRENSDWIRLNRDSYRQLFFGVRQSDTDYYARKDFKQCERIISQVQEQTIYDMLNESRNIILDNTHLQLGYIQEIIRKFNHLADIVLRFFDIDLQEAQTRVSKRNQSDEVSYIERQYKDYIKLKRSLHGERLFYPQTNPRLKSDPERARAVIIDLDGTLADNSHRSPFDESKVSEDKVIEPVAEIVRALDKQGYYILFVSGRTDACKEDTLRWLLDNDLIGFASDLYMRKAGDTRPDYIVKESIVEELASQFNIRAWIDDRLSVSREAHRLGIFCINVNQGFKHF